MHSFIDVLNTGFGVSIVLSISYQNEKFIILLDAGDNNSDIYKDIRRIKIVGYLKSQNIKHINLAILSHIHRDHIAGYNEILDADISIGTFISNMPMYPVSDMLLEIGKHYKDISTQYLLYSLQEYNKITNRLIGKTNILIANDTITYELDEFILSIVPVNNVLVQTVFSYLKQADNDKLTIEDRYKYLRLFDSQLNSTTLSLLLKKEYQVIFYSPGEIDLSFIKNHIVKESVKILHCPHHGDSNFLNEQILNILTPCFIIVCADSERTYNLPAKNLNMIVKKFCSAQIHFTETKKSTHQVMRFFIDHLQITVKYLLIYNKEK